MISSFLRIISIKMKVIVLAIADIKSDFGRGGRRVSDVNQRKCVTLTLINAILFIVYLIVRMLYILFRKLHNYYNSIILASFFQYCV